MEFQLLFSLFRFPTTLDGRFQIVISFLRLSFLYDIENRNLELRISFFVSVIFSLSYLPKPAGRMLALPVANNRQVFVRHFLIEENNSF